MDFKASITEKGAILLGENVACDAFDQRPLRVVTHAHADHLLGLQQSLKHCETVLMTPATKDLIEVLNGPLFLMQGNITTLPYEKPFHHDKEQMRFYYADHILGAAQVVVDDAEGTRIVYTGDFRLADTPVIEADVVVLEATYGNPAKTRHFENDVQKSLISLVEEGLKHGAVYVFGYHGKLQEVMQILHEAKVKAPFIVPEKVFQVCKICEKHGMRMGRYMLSSTEQAQLMMERKETFVAFYHMGSRHKIGANAFRIYVSGWEFNSACRKTGENEYLVALSDHSDFNGLLRYVEECKPKQVITDNYRIGDACVLAKEIQKRLGIPAKPLPVK
jgi:putative mRNA 3-end processing factor